MGCQSRYYIKYFRHVQTQCVMPQLIPLQLNLMNKYLRYVSFNTSCFICHFCNPYIYKFCPCISQNAQYGEADGLERWRRRMGPPPPFTRLAAGDGGMGAAKVGVGRHSHKRASSPAVMNVDTAPSALCSKGVHARTMPR